ncbi:MAG: hypothetical protein KUG79_02805 [Pseudomonadales bacterium]|nr:hypothetical protein [Pseudomonadales bacterium]
MVAQNNIKPEHFVLHALVNSQLMEQGVFTPLEWLLTSGRLAYEDYECWRLGQIDFLDQYLLGNSERIFAELDIIVAYAETIGLVSEIEEYLPWQRTDKQVALKMSADGARSTRLSQRFAPVQTSPQMDMFFDNPVVVLSNNIINALLDYAAADAQQYLDQLYQQAPNYADLAIFDELLVLVRQFSEPVFDPPAELTLLQNLLPDVKRLLRNKSRDFMMRQWRRLSEAVKQKGFSAAVADLHNSYILAQAEDWRGVSAAILAEPDWRQEIILCRRLAECGGRRHNRGEELMAWCHLCWQFGDQASIWLDSDKLIDAGIRTLWQAYCALEDELDLDQAPVVDEFPAWILINEPGLIHILAEDLPQHHQSSAASYRLVHQLLKARQAAMADQEIILRKALRQQQPLLLEALKLKL